MDSERPYSKREMDIILENLTKDFTLAIHKLDSHILALDSKIESVETRLESKLESKIGNLEQSFNGKFESVKVELSYLKIITTGILLAIISSVLAYFIHFGN
ncbi:MAG: hypothetical protein MK033_09530 [Candidatus Caenarcaniphilales bacterium]|nr:hypothetical protein [Candidatus Caenarcaniphilales bacterium]